MNIKSESSDWILAQNRRHIWSLCDSNGILTHKHLIRRETLNGLAKLAKLVVGSNPVAATVLVLFQVCIEDV